MIIDWIFNSIMWILIKSKIAESAMITPLGKDGAVVVYCRRNKGLF